MSNIKASDDIKAADPAFETHHAEVLYDDKCPEVAAPIADIDDGFDPGMIKRVRRKCDIRLIPILSAMYTISLIDRGNLSIARSANGNVMDREMQLDKGNHYSIITLVFFVTYIVLEIPSQLGLRKFGAAYWLGLATVAWGVTMIGMAFVHTWQQMAGLRAVLGAFESTLYPGAAFLIACWYPRREMAVRNAFFYVSSKALSGLGNILSYAIGLLHGNANLNGWQWIFLVQGLLTIVIGFFGVWLIVDFPDKAKFLSADEQQMVNERIQRDRGDAVPDAMTTKKFLNYAIDFKPWLFGIFLCSSTLGAYSMSYFLPVILQSMGFNNAESQLLTAPPAVFVAIPAMISAHVSDRYKMRAYPIAVNSVGLIIGTCMFSQIPKEQIAARYVGVFLAVGFASSNAPIILAWCQGCIRNQSKRGFSSALIIAWGGMGGIFSGVAYQQKERSKGYPTGIWLTVGMQVFTIVGSLALRQWLKYQNKRADRGEIIIEGQEGFRYQL